MTDIISLDNLQTRYEHMTQQSESANIAALAARLTEFEIAYGTHGRGRDAAEFSYRVTPPGYRDTLPYLQGHLILWLYGIDNLLDTCQQMEPAYDLHTIAVFAAQHPDTELTSEVLANLNISTAVDEIEPGASCSVLALGRGAGRLVRDIRASFPSSSGLQLFVSEFDREVWAEVTETLWRLEGNWHGYTIEQYLAVGAASIAALVCTALELMATPENVSRWVQLRPAIWQTGIICRLANDIATVERDRTEKRANALFLTSQAEAEAKSRAEELIAQSLGQLEKELRTLPASEATNHLAYVVRSMAALALIMYASGDFEAPRITESYEYQ